MRAISGTCVLEAAIVPCQRPGASSCIRTLECMGLNHVFMSRSRDGRNNNLMRDCASRNWGRPQISRNTSPAVRSAPAQPRPSAHTSPCDIPFDHCSRAWVSLRQLPSQHSEHCQHSTLPQIQTSSLPTHPIPSSAVSSALRTIERRAETTREPLGNILRSLSRPRPRSSRHCDSHIAFFRSPLIALSAHHAYSFRRNTNTRRLSSYTHLNTPVQPRWGRPVHPPPSP